MSAIDLLHFQSVVFPVQVVRVNRGMTVEQLGMNEDAREVLILPRERRLKLEAIMRGGDPLVQDGVRIT